MGGRIWKAARKRARIVARKNTLVSEALQKCPRLYKFLYSLGWHSPSTRWLRSWAERCHKSEIRFEKRLTHKLVEIGRQ
jgi:hypothetical protein